MGTNTGIGIGIGIPFKNNALGGDRPYLPPELKARLIGVWTNYGKKNTDADRNIIKNKIPNAGGDLEIINAAYRLNSGFGGYTNDFQEYPYNENVIVKDNTNAIFNSGGQLLLSYPLMTKDVPSFKIKVSGLSETYHFRYYYRDGNGIQHSVDMAKDGNYELPICYNVQNSSDGTNCGFANNGNDIITVEILPEFEGAFVTDGVDDLITSTKTVQEMGITDEVTVVSMIHQIDLNSTYTIATTNYIENSNSREHVRSDVYNYGKTGIYGYSASLINNTKSDIKNILGDEADYYVKSTNSLQTIFDAKFSVVGRISELTEASQVAWYWTIIANKVLTTDQINQVIAYFNLDRTLKPDILCNTIKQGITNENHAEFGDKLIDYSGNGRDIQLNNIAWDGDSGIGKYNYPNWKVTATIANTYSTIVNYPTVNGTYSINVNGVSELMQSIGLHLEIKYTTSTGIIYNDIKQDGVYSYILPDGATNLTLRFGGIPGIVNEPCNITITQIPSHAGALCLDGVNDFGQFVGDLGLKDYTLIMNRAYNNLINNQVPLVSSNIVEDQTPFIVEHWNTGSNAISFSYGASRTTDIPLDINKKIVYQSTYSYMGYVIPKGNAISTGNGITLGKFGNGVQYSAICLWSLMLFPYSMSEFLIERQLKKHKLGTLYPDMVEFRPVIKSNVLLDAKPAFVIRGTSTYLNAGDYVPENSQIWVSIKMNNIADRITKFTVNGKTIDIPENAYSEVTLQYGFPFVIDKSPQKIGITIEQDENYVQWNPVVESNAEYQVVDFYIDTYPAVVGKYYPINSKLRIAVTTKGAADEVTSLTVNGVSLGTPSVKGNRFTFNGTLSDKSPQKIDITIDEYIRFEDIVQPYPVIFQITDRNTNQRYSWGDKIKVGSSIRLSQGEKPNLLSGLYSIQSYEYEGKTYSYNQLTNLNIILTKQSISLSCNKIWLLDDNEPKCILSPRLLRIPNSSYKILGYIPDISGHGNHGVIHNSAYAEGSGVNEDGSYQFDGVDDFITIPTTVGGKQVLMKVNWQSIAGTAILYDQRTNGGFAIFNRDFDTNENKVPAYRARNIGGSTYIDGILNEYIYASELKDITHNIVELCDPELNTGTLNPKIGSSFLNSNYTQMSLYDFMLFDEISTEAKIKELNEYIGIEGGYVERPEYYWDAYGKKNTDTDRNLIADQVSKDVANALEVKNVAYNSESGYTDDNGLLLDGVEDHAVNAVIPAVTDFTVIAKRISQASTNDTMFITKGQDGIVANAALGLEYRNINGEYVYSFGTSTNVESIPDLITYCTPTNYNGKVLTRGNIQDTNGIQIGKFYVKYWKGVFYKMMLYTKTIDQLSINMLKNLFERDEIIDLDNPIFIQDE